MAMDNVASEVSRKVKSAIKAKLQELGTYSDDELPDYIMILVANRKTKDQMDDDLRLFLGQNTEKFTAWLHVVLQKLNAAALLQNKSDSDTAETEKPEPVPPSPPAPPAPTPATAPTPAPLTPPSPPLVVTKSEKKEKKKKDKSSKKKDKKEKKKKKDKKAKRHLRTSKERDKDAAVSPTVENIKICVVNEKVVEIVGTNDSTNLQEGDINEDVIQLTKSNIPFQDEQTKEDEEDLAGDVVDLRPDADDLALGLEDEPVTLPVKKLKVQSPSVRKEDFTPSQSVQKKEIEEESPSQRSVTVLSKITSNKETVRPPQDEQDFPKMSVHDRLGPAVARRIVNISRNDSDISGKMASFAIASVLKSVVVTQSSDGSSSRSGKRLEARVRPLISNRMKPSVAEEEELLPDPPRVVSTVGAILKRPHSDNEGSDEEPQTKRISSLASKVEVAPRPKRSGVQANTALILRAVADAHKSVSKLVKKPLEEKEEDLSNKRKELYTKSYQERQKQRLTFPSSDGGTTVKKIAITVPNAVKREQIEVMEIEEKITDDISKEKLYAKEEEEMDTCESPNPMEVEGPLPPTFKETSRLKNTNIKSRLAPLGMDDLERGNPRFIVTLDGFETNPVGLKSRLRGRPVRSPSLDEEEYIEEIEEWEEVEEMETLPSQEVPPPTNALPKTKLKSGITAPTAPSVAKVAERCRFWPSCKEGDACSYIHPTKMCNTFPFCKFADKCIYIHPTCKFDVLCTKIGCPFTHTASRSLAAAATVMKPVPAALPLATKKCRYFPKCTDMNCPFMHPKEMCKFGKLCHAMDCPYIHPYTTTTTDPSPYVATGAKLKWIAPKTTSNATPVEATPNKTSVLTAGCATATPAT